MPYQIEPYADELIVIGTAGADFNVGQEIEGYLQNLKEVFDHMPAPAIYVADARGMDLNFGDITGSMGMLTRGDMAVFQHPNLRAVVVVTQSSLITMGVRALGQSQYGSVKARVAATREEAIDIARSELAPST